MKNKAPRQNAHLHNKNPSPACGRGVGVRAFLRRTNPATAPLGEPSNRAAWRTQQPSRLAAPATTPLGEASVYPAWCVANLKFCTEKSLPPLAGEGGRRPEGGDKKPGFIPLGGPSNHAAWWPQQPHCLANPATTLLGEPSNHAAWRTQQPRRLAGPATTPLWRAQQLHRFGGPSNHAAWRTRQPRRLASPATTSLGGPSNHAAWRTQHLHRLASPATAPLGEPSNYTAWRVQQPRRLAGPATSPLGEPSNHAAWRTQQPRRLADPAITPLGEPGNHAAWRGQCLSRLVRCQSQILHGKIPSPACGGRGSHEKNARIFFMGTREGGRRPEGGIKNQDLSRLADPAITPLGEPSNHAA